MRKERREDGKNVGDESGEKMKRNGKDLTTIINASPKVEVFPWYIKLTYTHARSSLHAHDRRKQNRIIRLRLLFMVV
ncbi:hypothetical protein M0802_016953 [Mischocyttarus mexicanus]|nr:hypothetical protein M0802_016953 [Mischocyttarus mexicanus]